MNIATNNTTTSTNPMLIPESASGMRPQSSSSSTTTSAAASTNLPTTTTTTSSISSTASPDEEIYFQTEMYCEAIDGIYQERKNQSASASSCLSSSSSSTSSGSSKKAKEKLAIDYFKNLTTLEICNLVYLIDLKCFSSLQSVYALFMSKSNSIGNLSAQICSSLGCPQSIRRLQ